jgi:hypothetical protein
VALLVCGFVGGGMNVVVAETVLTLSLGVTPRIEKNKRVTVTAIES